MTLCRNPYMQGMHAHGCGQCMPCRINRKRIWMHRILLEAACSPDNSFLTLTYRDEAMPLNGTGHPTLSPRDLQIWLKRLRSKWSSFQDDLHGPNGTPTKLRYFAVGEYGDETQRPHYHVVLFGFPNCRYLNSRYSKTKRNCCVPCDLVRDTWSHGNVFLGNLEPASAGYVAGYVTKKLTSKDDDRLITRCTVCAQTSSRHPEFSRMSLKPGIGANFMHEVASTTMQFNLEEDTQGDVPSSLRHGTRRLPLGRYLRRRLRTLVGKEANAPTTPPDPEMLSLQLDARSDKENPSLRSHLLTATSARASSLIAKTKIFKQRKPL